MYSSFLGFVPKLGIIYYVICVSEALVDILMSAFLFEAALLLVYKIPYRLCYEHKLLDSLRKNVIKNTNITYLHYLSYYCDLKLRIPKFRIVLGILGNGIF